MEGEKIGVVSHWFAKIQVIGIELTGPLTVGDTIHVKGHTTDFEHKVSAMQIDNNEVSEAGSGDLVGLKVPERARVGDSVYKVT